MPQCRVDRASAAASPTSTPCCVATPSSPVEIAAGSVTRYAPVSVHQIKRGVLCSSAVTGTITPARGLGFDNSWRPMWRGAARLATGPRRHFGLVTATRTTIRIRRPRTRGALPAYLWQPTREAAPRAHRRGEVVRARAPRPCSFPWASCSAPRSTACRLQPRRHHATRSRHSPLFVRLRAARSPRAFDNLRHDAHLRARGQDRHPAARRTSSRTCPACPCAPTDVTARTGAVAKVIRSAAPRAST
jgi:hypothetical protein